MRKGGYLPANCVAVEKEEYDELKRKAELYDMYRRQMRAVKKYGYKAAYIKEGSIKIQM